MSKIVLSVIIFLLFNITVIISLQSFTTGVYNTLFQAWKAVSTCVLPTTKQVKRDLQHGFLVPERSLPGLQPCFKPRTH